MLNTWLVFIWQPMGYHTRNTNVGNDFVRGVSGGERKRVSIAEASLSGANINVGIMPLRVRFCYCFGIH